MSGKKDDNKNDKKINQKKILDQEQKKLQDEARIRAYADIEKKKLLINKKRN